MPGSHARYALEPAACLGVVSRELPLPTQHGGNAPPGLSQDLATHFSRRWGHQRKGAHPSPFTEEAAEAETGAWWCGAAQLWRAHRSLPHETHGVHSVSASHLEHL